MINISKQVTLKAECMADILTGNLEKKYKFTKDYKLDPTLLLKLITFLLLIYQGIFLLCSNEYRYLTL